MKEEKKKKELILHVYNLQHYIIVYNNQSFDKDNAFWLIGVPQRL